jgi:hypothetical protein
VTQWACKVLSTMMPEFCKPLSSDLNPCDCFVRGYLWDRVFKLLVLGQLAIWKQLPHSQEILQVIAEFQSSDSVCYIIERRCIEHAILKAWIYFFTWSFNIKFRRIIFIVPILFTLEVVQWIKSSPVFY